mmetsp:Transcript_5671/g.16863  ORF Transcript_5671/g.16863 Transcript_5671/m.16863 type:complete len:208 (-) Transcript_5671:302-925(-)
MICGDCNGQGPLHFLKVIDQQPDHIFNHVDECCQNSLQGLCSYLQFARVYLLQHSLHNFPCHCSFFHVQVLNYLKMFYPGKQYLVIYAQTDQDDFAQITNPLHEPVKIWLGDMRGHAFQRVDAHQEINKLLAHAIIVNGAHVLCPCIRSSNSRAHKSLIFHFYFICKNLLIHELSRRLLHIRMVQQWCTPTWSLTPRTGTVERHTTR